MSFIELTINDGVVYVNPEHISYIMPGRRFESVVCLSKGDAVLYVKETLDEIFKRIKDTQL